MASPKKKKTAQITLGGVLIVAIVIAAKLIFGIDVLELSEQFDSENQSTQVAPAKQQAQPNEAQATTDESAIRLLIDNEISGEMVLLSDAEIVKLLPDDTDEPRHQRLLLKLETGGTVLVAHNIDLARRIPAEEGDSITVYGQYEWNDRGGVLHWTHHAPRNNRVGGWIEFDGKRYQ